MHECFRSLAVAATARLQMCVTAQAEFRSTCPTDLLPAATATVRTLRPVACMHEFRQQAPDEQRQGKRTGEMAANKAFYSWWSSACRLHVHGSIADDDDSILSDRLPDSRSTADGDGAHVSAG